MHNNNSENTISSTLGPISHTHTHINANTILVTSVYYAGNNNNTSIYIYTFHGIRNLSIKPRCIHIAPCCWCFFVCKLQMKTIACHSKKKHTHKKHRKHLSHAHAKNHARANPLPQTRNKQTNKLNHIIYTPHSPPHQHTDGTQPPPHHHHHHHPKTPTQRGHFGAY